MRDEHRFWPRWASAVACAAALTVPALMTPSSIANAQQPDDDKGRYSMSPVDGGFIRLDKQTGAVALCTGKDKVWSCEPLADRSAAATEGEQAKLEAENKDLRARLDVLEERRKGLGLPLPAPPTPQSPPTTTEPGVGQLPTEEEIDKALDYVERVFKKLRDRVEKYQTPTPMPDGTPLSDGTPLPDAQPNAPPNAPGPPGQGSPAPSSTSPGSGAL